MSRLSILFSLSLLAFSIWGQEQYVNLAWNASPTTNVNLYRLYASRASRFSYEYQTNGGMVPIRIVKTNEAPFSSWATNQVASTVYTNLLLTTSDIATNGLWYFAVTAVSPLGESDPSNELAYERRIINVWLMVKERLEDSWQTNSLLVLQLKSNNVSKYLRVGTTNSDLVMFLKLSRSN